MEIIWFVSLLFVTAGVGFWLGRVSTFPERDDLRARLHKLTDRDEKGRFKK